MALFTRFPPLQREETLLADLSVNGTNIDSAGVRYRDGRSFTPNGKRNGLFIDLNGKNYQGYTVLDLSSALRDPMVRKCWQMR
ncbi:MAG: hypothetical protein R2795_07440 [Saprospiraceae bacterium]